MCETARDAQDHRARENLKQRMAEMSKADEQTPPGHDAFRQAVDAEIQVLLRVWEEEARRGDRHALYQSATCRRSAPTASPSSPVSPARFVATSRPRAGSW